MQRSRRTLVAIGLLVVGLQLAACTQQSAEADGATKEPATVEHIEGSEVTRLTLTAKAAERLGIRTKPVLAGKIGGTPRRIVPYSAVLYDANGDTWVYANLEPLAYIRERVTVAYIQGGQAVLTDGPPEGTPVVTVGAGELYGTEFRVGHESGGGQSSHDALGRRVEPEVPVPGRRPQSGYGVRIPQQGGEACVRCD